jgi:transposase
MIVEGRKMAYRTIHTKKNGAKYVYSVEGYWDKEKQAPRNRQVCLGRLDETTGEIMPSSRTARTAKRAAAIPEVTATSRVIGPYLLLRKIAADIGLEPVLQSYFPGMHEQILSLAFFLVQKGLPLYRCETWSALHRHPFNGLMPSQRVSDLLHSITTGQQQGFFVRWLKMLAEKECFCYDLTSVSSYSELNEYVCWGHNCDAEKLPQINIAMLYGQNSGLPAYFRRTPGNISDVATLETTMKSLDFLGQTRLTFVLDRGFYSETNIDTLMDAHFHFVLACPHRSWVDSLYSMHRTELASYRNRRATGEGEVLHMLTHLHNWKGRRCYLHIYHNQTMVAEETDALDLKLALWQAELASGQTKVENEWAYKKYFFVKETPKCGRKVIENIKAIETAKSNYCGFFSLLTVSKMDAPTALEVYRRKEVVENCFDDLKNTLDMKRLRIHSSAAMDARLFIQFVALILLSQVRRIKNGCLQLKNLTIREIMDAMESIVEVRYSGRYGKIITESGPLQRNIMDAFSVTTVP